MVPVLSNLQDASTQQATRVPILSLQLKEYAINFSAIISFHIKVSDASTVIWTRKAATSKHNDNSDYLPYNRNKDTDNVQASA